MGKNDVTDLNKLPFTLEEIENMTESEYTEALIDRFDIGRADIPKPQDHMDALNQNDRSDFITNRKCLVPVTKNQKTALNYIHSMDKHDNNDVFINSCLTLVGTYNFMISVAPYLMYPEAVCKSMDSVPSSEEKKVIEKSLKIDSGEKHDMVPVFPHKMLQRFINVCGNEVLDTKIILESLMSYSIAMYCYRSTGVPQHIVNEVIEDFRKKQLQIYGAIGVSISYRETSKIRDQMEGESRMVEMKDIQTPMKEFILDD